MATTTTRYDLDQDFEEHARTYRGFVKSVAIVAALALMTLGSMAWYFLG